MRFRIAWIAACLILAGCGKVEPTPPPPDLIKVAFTGSMEPTFHGGEIRPVEHMPIEMVCVGQIIIVWRGAKDYWVLHRVISIRKVAGEISLVTKGDANLERDQFICTKDIYGGVVNP